MNHKDLNLTEQSLKLPALLQQRIDEQNECQKKDRLISLDAYRGFTVVGMIVADHLGSIEGSPWWLVHKQWNGITLADLVFPAFLFIIGISLPIAINEKRRIKLKNIVRVFILFFLGLIYNFIKELNFQHLRIPGILQRSSICYGSILFIHWFSQNGKHKIKTIISALSMIAIVITYFPLMLSWQNPSIGCYRQRNLDPYCNFAGYVDRSVFTQNHILEKTDPEGIISTMNSIVTSYMGYVFGLILVASKNNQKRIIKTWLLIALLCLIPIYPCSFLFPFNKRLYTTTFLFAVLASSMVILTLFFVVIDYSSSLKFSFAPKIKQIMKPLLWMGMNPLAIFIVHKIISNIVRTWITIDGKSLFYIVYDAGFKWMPPEIGSIIYTMIYLILNFFVAWLLFKNKLFLRL